MMISPRTRASQGQEKGRIQHMEKLAKGSKITKNRMGCLIRWGTPHHQKHARQGSLVRGAGR